MSNSIFDKNMDALRLRYPEIANFLEGICDNSIDSANELIEVNTEDVSGKDVLSASISGRIYQLDSLYDDKLLLDMWFKGLKEEWPLDGKLVMFGFGSGMYVRHFLENAREDCAIIVHEPSCKIFLKVLEYKDISDIIANPRVRIVFGFSLNGTTIREYYEDVISYLDMQYLSVSYYLNYVKLFPQEAQDFVDGIVCLKGDYDASQHVYDRFGGYYSQNALNNFKYITDSLSYTELKKQMPKNQTAVVVSAGPSLDKNIDGLKKAEGKAFIIATITALKPLALKGIKPDITVITDGKKDGRYMSEAASKSVPMICSPICGYEILQLHTGDKLFVGGDCNHIDAFMEEQKVPFEGINAGGSVANACYTVARECGCNTVILVGQDLAYTDDKTHSQVTVRGAWNTKVEDFEHPIWDEDVYGNPIRTSTEFRMYKRWFEEEFAKYPDIKVIDATEGGIRIDGTDIMTLKEAVDKYCVEEFDFDEVLTRVSKLLDDKQREEYIEYIKNVPNQFGNLKRIIKETLADYASMRRLVETNRYHSSEMKKLYDKCKTNTDKVENTPVIEYVHYQLKEKSSELLSSVNMLEDDEKSELLSVCDMGQAYLNDMLQAIEELQPYIDIVKDDFK